QHGPHHRWQLHLGPALDHRRDHELRAPLGDPRHLPGVALPLADSHLLVRGAVGRAHLAGVAAAVADPHRRSAVLRGAHRARSLDRLSRDSRLGGTEGPPADVCMRIARHFMAMRLALLSSTATALLAGCGQKGALYLPPKPGAVVTSAPTPPPAPDTQS